MQNYKKGFIKFDGDLFMMICLGIVVFVLVGLVFTKCCFSIIGTSKGTHRGYITAVENTGLIFKTYSVYVKTDTQSSQEDKYCVVNESILPQIRESMESKTLVNINYDNGLFVPISSCSHGSESIITSINK